MRDAYHDELDAISDSLVEMTNLVGSAMSRATRRCSTPTCTSPRP